MNKKSTTNIRTIIIVVCIVAFVGFAGWRFYENRQGGNKAASVMEELKSIIPGLGVESDAATGMGRDPLAAVSIKGIDIVGVIEIPSLDIMAPVTGKGVNEAHFASWLDGSPVQGKFKVLASRDDLFHNIASLKPGDRAIFTDLDGVRYSYQVTTQYHLKKWDAGDNELMLCYESDSDTYFVVGCGNVE